MLDTRLIQEQAKEDNKAASAAPGSVGSDEGGDGNSVLMRDYFKPATDLEEREKSVSFM